MTNFGQHTTPNSSKHTTLNIVEGNVIMYSASKSKCDAAIEINVRVCTYALPIPKIRSFTNERSLKQEQC